MLFFSKNKVIGSADSRTLIGCHRPGHTSHQIIYHTLHNGYHRVCADWGRPSRDQWCHKVNRSTAFNREVRIGGISMSTGRERASNFPAVCNFLYKSLLSGQLDLFSENSLHTGVGHLVVCSVAITHCTRRRGKIKYENHQITSAIIGNRKYLKAWSQYPLHIPQTRFSSRPRYPTPTILEPI